MTFYQFSAESATARRDRPRKYGDAFKLKDWLEKRDEKTFMDDLTLYGGVKRVEFKTTLATNRITDGRPVRWVARKIGIQSIVGAKIDDIQEQFLRLARFLGLAA